MSKPKYRKGARVSSVGMFEALGTQWFILNGKTTHRSVIENMTYRTISGFVRRGQLHEALRADLPVPMRGKEIRAIYTEEIQTAEINTEVTFSAPKPALGEPIVAITPANNTGQTTIPYPGPYIIGCDLAQGESMTGRIEYRKRQEETE